MNKKFKILLLSTVVSSSVVFSTASCSHKNNSGNDTFKLWNAFKKNAESETIRNIVKQTHPIGWEDASDLELRFGPFKADDAKHIISVDIMRNSGSNETTATFKISFIKAQKYNIDQWKCTSQPSGNTGSWILFKEEAFRLDPNDLLNIVKKSSNWNKFAWKYGTTSQTKWVAGDEAEFDTFGSLTNDDASNYRGMTGKPTANESNFTITAIISKKGHEGLYDADPIKASIEYKFGEKYNINNWNSFTQKDQLQSLEKSNSIIDKQVEVAKNFSEFEKTNFATLGDDKSAIDHSDKNSIDKLLDRHGYPGHRDIIFLDKYSEAGSKGKEMIKYDAKMWESKVVFSFHNKQSTLMTLYLYFDFMYQNNDKAHGGTAFSFTWRATIGPKI